jgi:hypothetical protein
MAGLVPAIHVSMAHGKTWMAGTSPAMTKQEREFGIDSHRLKRKRNRIAVS